MAGKDSGIVLSERGMAVRLAELERTTAELRRRNNALEETLGEFTVCGQTTRAVATVEGKVSIRKDGRDAVVFDAAQSLHDAKMAARRAIVRLANHELSKPRTPRERKQTLVFDSITLRETDHGLKLVGPQLELVDE